MAYINGNKPIVTDGLIYALDFGNSRSYLSGSTQATSMAYDQAVTSVSGSPAFEDGLLSFTGTQYIKRNSSLPALDPNGTFTVMVVGQPGAVEGTLLHQDSFNATANASSSLFGFGLDSGDFSRSYPGLVTSSLQHVTYRYSQGTIDTFINGIPVTASQANSALTTTAVSNALFLGSGSAGFSGSLAQFYVYNRALSADEIYTTYLVSAGRNGLPEIPKPYTQDENVYKYVQTTGITDNDTISAISTFVSSLKSNGLWNKMTAIYPFLTTSTGSQAVNLKDPGVLGLGLTGSFTGSNVGLTPASSTAYVDTLPSNIPYPSINSASAHLSLVSYDVPQGNGFLAGNSARAVGGDLIIQSGSRMYHAFKTVGTSSFVMVDPSITNVEVLVVAGGGAGGQRDSGGGGAGGVIYSSSFSIAPLTPIEVIIGRGGIGSTNAGGATGENGFNSIFSSIVATGGGGGGSQQFGSTPGNGGSGGGGGGGIDISGSGIVGQGFDGGTRGGITYAGGGGGGASQKGQDANTTGAGGSGSFYPQYSGINIGSPAGWFGGGGGGSYINANVNSTGPGGPGGGGNGGRTTTTTSGVINTGGGGGSHGAGGLNYPAGSGGSGIVVVSYDLPASALTGSGTGFYLTDSAITASVNSQFTAGITGSGNIGFLTVSRTGSNSFSIRKNNSTATINSASLGALSTDIFFNTANLAGSGSLPQPTSISYASIGAGLTDSEVSTYYNLVSQFQTNLKRQNTLLDNYSGAAAAYSLRRIGPSGYFGPAIRVRRDSDNALRDIGFTSDGQLDTVGLLDFVGVTGSGFVQTWYDQSGNGNDATQGTAGSQPLLLSSGSIITRKQKPYFQASPTQFLRLGSPIVAGIADYSWWITYEKSNNSGTAVLIQGDSNYHWLDYNSTQYLWETLVTQQTAGVTYLINTIKNYPTSLTFYRNSVSVGTTTPSTTARSATEYIPGNIARGTNTLTLSEFIYYPSNQFENKTALDSNINSYYKLYGDATASFDPDYQAFITATGITEPTQSAALETLVSDLKSYGLWNKMKAIYPMVTDRNNRFAQSEAFNITWNAVSASVSADQTTAPDGTSTADLILEEAGSGDHYIYQTIDNGGLVSGSEYVLSVYGKFYNRPWLALQVNNDGAQAWFDLQNGVTGSFTGSSVSITDVGSGWYRCALFFTSSADGARNQHIHLADADGNFSYTGVTTSGSYLWGAQFENGNLLGPYRETTTTGFTTGSMLDQMKFNLVNPVDTDAGFRLTYSGSLNSGYSGIKGDATTGYIITNFNPSSSQPTANNLSLSTYSRTFTINLGSDLGSSDGSSFIDLKLSDGSNNLTYDGFDNTLHSLSTTNTDTRGYYLVNHNGATTTQVFKNKIQITGSSVEQTLPYPDSRISILTRLDNDTTPTTYSDRETALVTIGDGLTDYQAKALYWIVQKFQTTLGRQVY